MFVDSILNHLFKRVRGRDLRISPDISSISVLLNLAQRGLVPYLRGLVTRPWLGATKGSFFLGKGCTILSKGLLCIGKNVYIGNYSYLDCLSIDGVNIGNNVKIREGCWLQLTSHYDKLGASVDIGDSVYIRPKSILGAAIRVTMGDRCQLGANVSLIAENHLLSGDAEIFGQGVDQKGITLERDVWIGNNATMHDGVTIGEGSVIGAGAVLTSPCLAAL